MAKQLIQKSSVKVDDPNPTIPPYRVVVEKLTHNEATLFVTGVQSVVDGTVAGGHYHKFAPQALNDYVQRCAKHGLDPFPDRTREQEEREKLSDLDVLREMAQRLGKVEFIILAAQAVNYE